MFGFFTKKKQVRLPDEDRLVPDPEIDATPSLGPKIALFLFISALAGSGAYWYRASHRPIPVAPEAAETFTPSLKESGAPVGRIQSFEEIMHQAQGFLSGAGATYGEFRTVAEHLAKLGIIAKDTQIHWAKYLFEGKGEMLTALRGAREEIKALYESGNKILSADANLRNFLPFKTGDILALQVELGKAASFLDALVPYLELLTPHKFALLLLNTSEIRPGGGFIGSYAEITVASGSIESIVPRDITEADREFSGKIIPPKPLQLITKNWRAADANWFFDFASSSEKTLSFLEKSSLYGETTTFDGVIAITPKVIEDILELTGPIPIDTRTQINSENFLSLIQEEVQNAQAKNTRSPKEILGILAPKLIEALTALTSDARDSLFARAPDWFSGKHASVYARNPEFQRFFESVGITGSLYSFSSQFYGDYLAVVAANVGGGKSDARIVQKINLESQIGNDGVVNNHLEILRINTATSADPWWYRVANQAYLKVFVMPNAQLANVVGLNAKKIKAPLEYAREGYVADSDVAGIESTEAPHLNYPNITLFKESGRSGFSGWITANPGKIASTTLDYRTRLPRVPVHGEVYTFVFEKQMGVIGEYSFAISAPVGFRFKENNLPVFEFHSKDPLGRTIITLTLEQVL